MPAWLSLGSAEGAGSHPALNAAYVATGDILFFEIGASNDANQCGDTTFGASTAIQPPRLLFSTSMRPVAHQAHALLEQVTAPIGGLDRATNRVCQRHLHDFVRVAGGF